MAGSGRAQTQSAAKKTFPAADRSALLSGVSSSSPPTRVAPGSTATLRAPWLLALLALAAAIVAAYRNGLGAPFIFDDTSAIVENPTIWNLRDLKTILSPPSDSGVTVNGRPLVNLSLALNYAAGGISVRGYHLFNLGLHLATTVLVFGLVRRTLLTPRLATRWAADATLIAFAIAALWSLHPIQTQSVTYVIQRAESLVAFFYVAVLYTLVRSSQSPRPSLWLGLSMLACLLGMGAKEVMVSAPLIAFLYYRTFVVEDTREILRTRGLYFLLCAATWILLAVLVMGSAQRGGTAGFGTAMPWWKHALVQCWAVPRYLWLTLFPSRLIFDYGYGSNVLLCLQPLWIAVGGVLVATGVIAALRSLWRWSVIGFVSIAGLAILSPSSSIVPILTEPIAEHRMYLPSVGIAVGLVALAYRALGRRGVIVLSLAVPALALGTVARNRIYSNERLLWHDTVAKIPCNGRAHNALGSELFKAGDTAGALAEIHEALRIIPDFIDARANLGYTLKELGQSKEGIVHLEAALKMDPRRLTTLLNLGGAYFAAGDSAAALTHFERALELRPAHAEAHNNIGVIRLKAGQAAEAERIFRTAIANRPTYADAHYNLGTALEALGRPAEAAEAYRTSIALEPKNPDALNNLAGIQIRAGDIPAAFATLQRAVQLQPPHAEVHNSLGFVFMRQGKPDAAAAEFEAALRARPDYAEARNNLAIAREAMKAPGR